MLEAELTSSSSDKKEQTRRILNKETTYTKSQRHGLATHMAKGELILSRNQIVEDLKN